MTIGKMLRGALLAGAALLTATPALADVKAGVDAWSRGDYTGAVKEWQGPADKGDADAQFNLGQAYKLGRGVKADLVKAEELFFKAAGRGHPQAADNYGLLLFQRGEHAKAMPYISAAAGRGDARAQYLLGIAHFNGDNAPKDWTRAYALVSLAQQAGLAQAAAALAQMDQYIPLEQRQQSVPLASQLAEAAQAVRTRQLAAADLGVGDPLQPGAPVADASVPMGKPLAREPFLTPDQAVAAAARAAGTDTPRTAGADYARPRAPVVSTILNERPPAPPKPITPKPPRIAKQPQTPGVVQPPAPAPAAAGGAWRVQLGAFGVAANADGLWNRVKSRPELAGHARINAPAGRLIKLQAGGFGSQSEAQAACSRLSAAGFTCIAVRN